MKSGETGIEEFVRRFVFNALIGNADMHMKNWSLVYPDQRNAELSPAYDFVSTIAAIPEDTLALNFTGSKTFDQISLDRLKVDQIQRALLRPDMVIDAIEASEVEPLFPAKIVVKHPNVALGPLGYRSRPGAAVALCPEFGHASLQDALLGGRWVAFVPGLAIFWHGRCGSPKWAIEHHPSFGGLGQEQDDLREDHQDC